MFDDFDDPQGDAPPVGMVDTVVRAAARRRRVRRLSVGATAAALVALVMTITTVPVGDADPAQEVATGPAVPPTGGPDGSAGAVESTGPATTWDRASAVTSPPESPPVTSEPAPTTSTPTPTPPEPEPAPSPGTPEHTCSATEGGDDQPVAKEEFETRLRYAWHLCQAPSVFGTDEGGLEIRSDHRWSKLARTEDGRYVRMQGWGNEGTWESVDTSAMNGPGHWQLNLYIDGSGTVHTQPQFARNVPKMRLSNNGVYVGEYARLPEAAVVG